MVKTLSHRSVNISRQYLSYCLQKIIINLFISHVMGPSSIFSPEEHQEFLTSMSCGV